MKRELIRSRIIRRIAVGPREQKLAVAFTVRQTLQFDGERSDLAHTLRRLELRHIGIVAMPATADLDTLLLSVNVGGLQAESLAHPQTRRRHQHHEPCLPGGTD